ncbi:glycosyltransferase [Cognatishimia sp.]|uniref:glycosyltransferase n=1 Tax=Cognatishimia sp. TaxID=2211648 RepID=UPI003511AEBA
MNLTLAIPCHNDADGLMHVLSQAAEYGIFEAVIVVDDGSDTPVTDTGETYPFELSIHRHETALGPGVARNKALECVKTSHVLFFDSDDLLSPELIDLWKSLKEQDFDFCIFHHNDSRNGPAGGLTSEDASLWHRAGLLGKTPSPVTPEALPILAETANYPWNKIYNVGFLRQNKLGCSSVFMHEDVELHWLGFSKATRILASTYVGATHFIAEDADRLTNLRSIKRYEAFAPMREVHQDLVAAGGFDDPLTLAYLRFLDRLWNWMEEASAPQHMELFRAHKDLFFTDRIAGQQFEAVQEKDPVLAQCLNSHKRLRSPEVHSPRARLRVHLSGEHAKRTPLSYPDLSSLFEGSFTLVSDPYSADATIFAHTLDIKAIDPEFIAHWRAYQQPIILLSEEPFWDTIWGNRPMEPVTTVTTGYGGLPVHQISHQTSGIFQFDKIPYYLLTNSRFERAYSAMFKRNAALSEDDWRKAFEQRAAALTFMFERRPEAYHSVSWPDGDLIGLCSWRTELAETCTFDGVERRGHSWDGSPSRLDLNKDWHEDKLQTLDGHARMIGALENTHQPQYITEKFFDAFACGGVPVYFASESHRIHNFGLPEESWINLYGLSPDQAASVLAEYQVSPTFFEAYREAQIKLADLFCNPDNWRAERARWAKELPIAIGNALKSPIRVKRPR